MRTIKSPFRVEPGETIRLKHRSTRDHGKFEGSDDAEKTLAKHRDALAELQERFYASQSKALLIVLQGMDTAGKDGAVRHIFSGINPQGCQVASFKVPTPLEQRHDFLWRCHAQAPPLGSFGIFNRSHYEDVLSPRVHGAITGKVAHERMRQINDWERTLAENGTLIVKFFLHISHAEQTERLQARIDAADKHWKLSAADFEERVFWDDYQDAYEDILSRTSTDDAPWFVIPSDHKWFRNVAISEILVELLDRQKLKYPKPPFDPAGLDLKKLTPKAAAEFVAARAKAEKL